MMSNQWIESQLPSCLPPELPPPDWPSRSTHPISLDHGLQVYPPTRSMTCYRFALWWPPSAYHENYSIMAFKCIPKLTGLQPVSSRDGDLLLHVQTLLITACWLAQSWPPSATLITRSITALKCITKHTPLCRKRSHSHGLPVHISLLPRWRPPSSSDHCLQVHLQSGLITACKCISNLAQLRPQSLHNHGHGVNLYVYSIDV